MKKLKTGYYLLFSLVGVIIALATFLTRANQKIDILEKKFKIISETQETLNRLDEVVFQIQELRREKKEICDSLTESEMRVKDIEICGMPLE